MGGLFMPFANMHTQMLSMLADHPYQDKMEWRTTLRATAAEYGAYMLKHTVAAWKAQVCRTMRLRQSMSGMTGSTWKYQWIVLKPVTQPNAAKQCGETCGADGVASEGGGWCDWCGGKNVGACCKHGDTSDPICKKFDAPVVEGTFTNGWPAVCVHNDCIQSNTAYNGDTVKVFMDKMTPEECQSKCVSEAGAVKFTLKEKSCTCFKTGATRHTEDGVSSGPTICAKPDDSVEAREDRFQAQLEESAINAPMKEIETCDSKSEGVSDYAQAEKDHPEWVKKCMTSAVSVITKEFNSFYKRIGTSLDSMAWSAGCGAQRATAWDEGGWNSVSQDSFDSGSFGDCDWNKEEEMDKKMRWHEDTSHSRGWTGTSKVDMDSQAKATIGFPMPTWLKDLSRQMPCLENTAAGKVKDNADGRSTAINTMMESVSVGDAGMNAGQ